MSSLEAAHKQFKSGEKFTVTGYYKYAGHVDPTTKDCFIPMHSSRMLFKDGETVPMLGSCPHEIKWELIREY